VGLSAKGGSGWPGWDEADEVPAPNRCFACRRCHGVITFSRAHLQYSWNQVVLHCSGGLMYGREVPRPPWLTAQRKRAYTPRPRKTISPQRQQMTRLLANTNLTLAAIARHMGWQRSTARSSAARIYKQHNVPDRQGLRQALAGHSA
jgi:tRNA-dihydrouridine synthase